VVRIVNLKNTGTALKSKNTRIVWYEATHVHFLSHSRIQLCTPADPSYLTFSLHISYMKLKFSSRRHYGNMDTEAAPGLGLEMQQPPAVFADGNVVAANGQNMNFNNQPAVLAEHMQILWQPPSCASKCSLVCGVIFFVVLTAIFSVIASTMGALLPFSSGP
jgi:hypothetical protein